MTDDVHKITLQTKRPAGSFPGAVEHGHYVVADGFVVLTDADGQPTSDKRLLNPGGDPKLIAMAMIKARRRNSGSPVGFNDKLLYKRIRY